jgi:hypothetical protein
MQGIAGMNLCDFCGVTGAGIGSGNLQLYGQDHVNGMKISTKCSMKGYITHKNMQ